MNQIKATSVQICIFTPHDLKSIGLYPPAEQYLYQMFGNAIIELRQRHGAGNTPVYLDFCPIDQAVNASILSQNGGSIMNLPAVQLYAKYADGTGGQYFLKKGLTDIGSDTPLVTEKTALQYTEALLYRLSPVTEPILCKLLPPLCSLGWYVWLGAAIYTTYKTTQARNVGQYAWGTAAALTWQAFIARGGLKELGSKVGIGALNQQEKEQVLLFEIMQINKLKERRNRLPKSSNKRPALQLIIDEKESEYRKKRERWGFPKY